MPRSRRIRARSTLTAAAWAASAGLAGCTVFDGLAPDTSDAAAPTPETTFLPVQQAATVCGFAFENERLATSIRASVGVPVSTTSFAACMSWLGGPIPPGRRGFAVEQRMLKNMAEAINVNHALASAFVQQLAADDPRCTPGVTTRCLDGSHLLDCATHRLSDCTSDLFADVSSCLGPPGAAACAVRSCAGASATCEQTHDILTVCDPATKLLTGYACTALGLACPAGMTGAAAACQTDEGLLPCGPGEAPGSTQCDQQHVLVCTESGTRTVFDCSTFGGTCTPNEPTKRCRIADEECSPFDATGVDVCDGTRLTTCVGGHFAEVECASLGMTCVPAAGGKSGHCGALANASP
jgi:hypothetical protein